MSSHIIPDADNIGLDFNSSASNIEHERTPGAVAVMRINGREAGIAGTPDGAVVPAGIPQTNSSDHDSSNSTAYKCGSLIIFTECESGQHHFAKKIVCGKEWCPDCGQEGSQAHNRRIARWLPKFQQISRLGYFVIEFPEKYRKVVGYAYSRKALDIASKRIVDVMAGKRMGRSGRVGGWFSRGLVRWHWFGDKEVGKYNPHANVVVDGAYIEGAELDAIKEQLRKALKCPDLIVHYSYFEQPGEIYHKLKYITRATFRQYEWSPYMANQLYGFRNCRWWGTWKDEPAWTLNSSIEAEAEAIALRAAGALQMGFCPVCGAQLKKWSRPVDSAYLTIWGAIEIGDTGYYVLPHQWWIDGEMSPAVRLRLDSLGPANGDVALLAYGEK